VLGCFATPVDFVNIPMQVGTSELGGGLSLARLSTALLPADSYARLHRLPPSDRSAGKVFFSTWVGLIIPLLFTEFLGIAVLHGTSLNGGNNKYASVTGSPVTAV